MRSIITRPFQWRGRYRAGLSLFTLTLLYATSSGASSNQVSLHSGTKHAEFVVDGLHIQGITESMEGMPVNGDVHLPHDEKSKLLWIKYFGVDVEGLSGTKKPLEYICHAWAIPISTTPSGRPVKITNQLLTISQGMDTMRFPVGYGLKVEANTIGAANIGLLASISQTNALFPLGSTRYGPGSSLQNTRDRSPARDLLYALAGQRLACPKNF